MKKLLSVLVFGTLLCALLASNASAQFGATDFLVADFEGDRIAVYNSSLVFQSYLDIGFNEVAGLTQVTSNTVAAGGRTPSRIKIYNSAGMILQDFSNVNIGAVSDLKSSGGNRLYSGTQAAATAVSRFSTTGTFLGIIGSASYAAVAVLPGDILWASTGGPSVDTFNHMTGAFIATIAFGNGQLQVDSMFYSPSTSTVLITDSATGTVFERTTTGAFVRQFTGGGADLGVTRGPGGDVFATEFPAPLTTVVHRWTSAGAYLGSTSLSANVTQGRNIIWAGNLAPSAASVSVSGRVIDANGRGVAKATVTLTDSNGAVRTAVTNPFGYYRIDGIVAGTTCVVGARHKRYDFTSQTISADQDFADLNFTAN